MYLQSHFTNLYIKKKTHSGHLVQKLDDEFGETIFH